MKYYHKDQYVNHVVPYTQSPCPRNMVLISVSISKKLLLDAACGEHCDPGTQGAQLIFKPLTCRMPFYALLAPNSTFLSLSSITLAFGSYSLGGTVHLTLLAWISSFGISQPPPSGNTSVPVQN